MKRVDEDHGAELKTLATLHGEDIAVRCRVRSGKREVEEKRKRKPPAGEGEVGRRLEF